MSDNFYCGRCMSNDTKEIEYFKGESVKPDDYLDDNNTGIVVQCQSCNEITGYLILMTGVVKNE